MSLTKEFVDLYFDNKLSEATEVLEKLIEEKVYNAIMERKSQMVFFPEGEIKVNNKKKKNKLEVRAGRGVGAVNAKHVGRTMFRSMEPKQLKTVLATEQFRPIGFHSKASQGLKKHLRLTHPIQKQRRNRRFYKSLQNRLDRK